MPNSSYPRPLVRRKASPDQGTYANLGMRRTSEACSLESEVVWNLFRSGRYSTLSAAIAAQRPPLSSRTFYKWYRTNVPPRPAVETNADGLACKYVEQRDVSRCYLYEPPPPSAEESFLQLRAREQRKAQVQGSSYAGSGSDKVLALLVNSAYVVQTG